MDLTQKRIHFTGFHTHPVAARDSEVFLCGGHPLGRPNPDGSPDGSPTAIEGQSFLLASRSLNIFPTPSRVPGTCSFSHFLWIATSWLATGLYVGPAVSGHEPKYQRLGVNVRFGALILVVGVRITRRRVALGIQQRLGHMWFWFGSQGI